MRTPRWLPVVVLLCLGSEARAQVRPAVYLCFGDSYTAGYDEDVGGETPGYPGYLTPLLQGKDPASIVYNAGHSGESTGQGLVRLPGQLAQYQPQFALILEGLNDLRNGASAAGVAFNLERMTQICAARGTIAILSSIPPDDAELSRGIIQGANQEILEIVGDGSIVGFADAYAAFAGHPEYYSGSHPNQGGYQVLASVFYDAVQARGTLPPPPPDASAGDIDGSGLVDGWDLIILAQAFGSGTGSTRYNDDADLNFDGVVDGADLSLLAANFGKRAA